MEKVRLWEHGWPDVEKGDRIGGRHTPWSQPPGAAGEQEGEHGT